MDPMTATGRASPATALAAFCVPVESPGGSVHHRPGGPDEHESVSGDSATDRRVGSGARASIDPPGRSSRLPSIRRSRARARGFARDTPTVDPPGGLRVELRGNRVRRRAWLGGEYDAHPWTRAGLLGMAGALLVLSVWHRPDIAVALAILSVPFTLLELWRPLRRQRPALRRTGAATDIVSFVVNEVLAGVGLLAVLLVAVPVVRALVPPALPAALSAQPSWLRWVESFVVAEVSGYWGHRWSHEVPLLWRFHRVHHSAPELDWLAPSRRHPLDAIVARSSTALPVLALGFAVPTVATYFALKRLQGLFVHANVDVRFGVVERLVATPFFHHWHHSADPGTWNTNYAGSIPAVDWLFGTLHLPNDWPHSYGCSGDVPDRGYVDRLIWPWRSNTRARSSQGAANSTAENELAPQ
jgi:sterol desaturase/sphingolipid hydroxylase (fatty acid hydroxylase superfamily)